MIIFQSKIGTFKFKSNPSLVYTQSFLKVFRVCVYAQRSLYALTYYMLACPSILHYLDYTITWIKKSFSKVVMWLQGMWFNYEEKIYKAQSNSWRLVEHNFSFQITSIPLTLHNKAQIALLLLLLFFLHFVFFLLLFKTIFFFNFFFSLGLFEQSTFLFSLKFPTMYAHLGTPPHLFLSFFPKNHNKYVKLH